MKRIHSTMTFALWAILTACSSNDALLGGGGAGGQGGDGGASTGTGGPGGGGASGGTTTGSGGSVIGCPDASVGGQAAFCPSNPDAVEGAPCTTSGASCSLCSPNVSCCRHFLFCTQEAPGCKRWHQLEAGPCADPDSGDTVPVLCGGRTCSPLEFCMGTSGPPPLPGADPYQYSCSSIPKRCSIPATPPTCACLVGGEPDAATRDFCADYLAPVYRFRECLESAGRILVRCDGP